MLNKNAKDIRQKGRDALDRRIRLVTDRFRKSVRPIYRSLDGTKPELVGSCFLLAIGTDTFAVSAAHVTDESPKFALYIAGTVRSEPVQMVGEIISTPIPDGGRDFDQYDTSFWRLSERDLQRLGSVEPIMEEKEIYNDLGDTSNHLFTAYGYPIVKNRKSVDNRSRKIKMTAFPYSSRIVDNPGLARKLKISGEDHFFLDFKKRSSQADGSIVTSPDPRGMSGGALIDVGTYSSLLDPEHLRANYGRLAGLLLERHKPYSAILAVKIDFVISLMRKWQNS